MATFSANGFEVDEDNPQVPLIALVAAAEKTRSLEWVDERVINFFIDQLGIPMHILAETDQNLHG